MKKRIKYFLYFLIGIGGIMSAVYGSLVFSVEEPAVSRPFFGSDGSQPLAIAHRGGGGQAPENTLYAFERAAALGIDVIELDVHGTADGELIVIHDKSVERTTDGAGLVKEKTLGEIKKLDAGYRWSPDGGKTFPLRGIGIRVPTLREVFARLPGMRFNIEPKQDAPSISKSLCGIIHEYKTVDKVVVGSFDQSIIDEFRRRCADVATSASTTEVGKFLAMYKTGVSRAYSPAMQALQIPGFVGVTKELVDAAHERNLKVHVWTINDQTEMERLLKIGVDGIMTDYPDRLLEILRRRLPPRR